MWCLLAVWTNRLTIWLYLCEDWSEASLALCSEPFFSFHVTFEEGRSDWLWGLGCEFRLSNFFVWFILISNGIEGLSPFVNVVIIKVTSFHLIVSTSHSFLWEVVDKILLVLWIVILLISLVFFLEIFMVIGFDVIKVSFGVEFFDFVDAGRMRYFIPMNFLFVNYHLLIIKLANNWTVNSFDDRIHLHDLNNHCLLTVWWLNHAADFYRLFIEELLMNSLFFLFICLIKRLLSSISSSYVIIDRLSVFYPFSNFSFAEFCIVKIVSKHSEFLSEYVDWFVFSVYVFMIRTFF